MRWPGEGVILSGEVGSWYFTRNYGWDGRRGVGWISYSVYTLLHRSKAALRVRRRTPSVGVRRSIPYAFFDAAFGNLEQEKDRSKETDD